MKLYKDTGKLMACFTVKELVDLLLWPVELSFLNKTLNARSEGKKIDDATLGEIAIEWGKGSANSKDYEYWSAIFSLYEDFGDNSEICFYLKDTFNPHKDSIASYLDLEKFKQDPPDVIIKNKQNGYAEFELKRYREELNEEGLVTFIKNKILRYSVPFNFCIILQHNPGTVLPQMIFEDLHKSIKELPIKRNLGNICFIFNANNQHMIFAHVYPELNVYKQPFSSGSDQIKKLMSQK